MNTIELCDRVGLLTGSPGGNQFARRVSEPQVLMTNEVGDSASVRAYRAPDAPVVNELRRNGRVYGNAGADCQTVVKAMPDVLPASRHRIWVAETDGRVIGAIAVAMHQEQIAHILWLCVATGVECERQVTEQLVKATTAHVREHGCLKLVVHTPLAASNVAGFLHDLGFEFSRERGVGGAHVLEFYLNLYVRPHSRQSQRLVGQDETRL